MRLRTRLRRLEQRIAVDHGCPACRDRRSQSVITESRRLPDGTTEPVGDWPAPCIVCGNVPEWRIIEVVRPILAGENSERECDAPARTPRSALAT